MSNKCYITGKTRNNGYSISHSHIRTKKIQGINLQNKKIWSVSKNRWVKIKVSTKGIKTLFKQKKFSV